MAVTGKGDHPLLSAFWSSLGAPTRTFYKNQFTDALKSVSTDWFFAGAAGGTVYDVIVNESSAATDTQSSSAAFSASRAESISAADSQSATADYLLIATESVTVTDDQTGGLLITVIVNESVSVADAQDALAVFSGVVTESAEATDSQSATAAYLLIVTETSTVSDAQDATALFATNVQESLSVTDSYDVAVSFLGAVLEAIGITDSATTDEIIAMLGGLFVSHPSGIIELALILDPLSEIRLMKNELVSLYLVDISDPNASPVRVRTSSGVKAVRRKT